MNILSAVADDAANKALSAAGIQRRWSSGLCDCCKEFGSCLDVMCCTSCQVSRQCEAIDGKENSMDCCTCILSMILLNYGSGGAGILAMIIRYRLIAKFNLVDESNIETFCKAGCCPYCSLCQTHREMANIRPSPGGTCCGAMS